MQAGRYYDDITCKQIADKLRIPEGTVTYRIYVTPPIAMVSICLGQCSQKLPQYGYPKVATCDVLIVHVNKIEEQLITIMLVMGCSLSTKTTSTDSTKTWSALQANKSARPVNGNVKETKSKQKD